MKKLSLLFFLVFLTSLVSGKEYHVSVKGNDKNDGTASNPFKTISFAAQVAQPGDIITVHEGTYRERITPPLGGVSDEKRIVYRAADGEKPEIKGSEVITGWENIGSHIVRNNTIFNCEQIGICGSLGAAFSQIINNHIYNIWAKRLFAGAEMGGIKIHASIDLLIKNNRIHNAGRGMWMDWMAQGTRITGNLCYDNTTDDLFMEVDHGPYLIDNNIFLSEISLRDWSEGGAFVHNLIAGRISFEPQDRTTPYHLAHSTQVVALKNILGGDDRFFNNIFIAGYNGREISNDTENKLKDKYGLEVYNTENVEIKADGNIYLKGAKPYSKETIYTLVKWADPNMKIVEEGTNVYLNITIDKLPRSYSSKLITTELLGNARTPGLAFENPDGSPVRLDSDYSGKKRNEKKPFPGPFENPGTGVLKLKVW